MDFRFCHIRKPRPCHHNALPNKPSLSVTRSGITHLARGTPPKPSPRGKEGDPVAQRNGEEGVDL